MTQAFSMDDGQHVAQRAAREIETWLYSRPNTMTVQNVESDPIYQAQDVDLLWTTYKQTYRVEIKGDRWDKSGNFFFETHSNKEKGTPGCFLYTTADLVFYYFIAPHTLYILPMPATREWFVANMDRFKERETHTVVGHGEQYTTVGRLAPIAIVLREVQDIKQFNLTIRNV